MRRKRIVQAGKCYHLVSRVAHKAFFFDEEEKDRFVDLLMRVDVLLLREGSCLVLHVEPHTRFHFP